MKKFKTLIVVGNPSDGLTFVGPFDSIDAANIYAQANQHIRENYYYVDQLEEPTTDEE